jgi:DNA-binding transcriptional LysR family regulator
MNFNQLWIFHKVAAKEHFTRAAEELFISQPAVSKQVQELEKTLGQPLFEQIGRRVHLTEAGHILYDYADRIFKLANEAEIALQELQGLTRGHLAIGASMTIGTYLLPNFLGRFHTLYPNIELSLDIANAEEVQAKVLSNQLDLGLVEGFVTEPSLYKSEWRQDEMILIDSTQQPLIQQTELDLTTLIDSAVPFILREIGSGTRAVLDDALQQHNLIVKPVLELNSLEAIKRMVAAGLGVSFVSEHSVQLEIKVGLVRQVPVTNFKLIRSLYLVYLQSKKLSQATKAFLELLG